MIADDNIVNNEKKSKTETTKDFFSQAFSKIDDWSYKILEDFFGENTKWIIFFRILYYFLIIMTILRFIIFIIKKIFKICFILLIMMTLFFVGAFFWKRISLKN